jgi:hypothetical protein
MKLKQFKLLLIIYSIIIGITGTSIACAQKKVIDTNKLVPNGYMDNSSIRVKFNVYLNDIAVSSNDYDFILMNDLLALNASYKMPEKFTVLLQYDQTYKFRVSKKGFNSKTLSIITTAPIDNWLLECNIFLYDDEPDRDCGYLKYESIDKKFKHFNYEQH